MEQASMLEQCPENHIDGMASQLFLALIGGLLLKKCHLGTNEYYLNDYSQKITYDQSFDFIIVGGGTAGSTLAHQLANRNEPWEKNWSILVVEAGKYPSVTSEIPSLFFGIQGTDEDWQYKAEVSDNSCLGMENNMCRWPRGKVLGGCSSIGAMLYVKGHQDDYDQWEKLGNAGWNSREAMKHFKAIECLPPENLKYENRTKEPHLRKYENNEPIRISIKNAAEELVNGTCRQMDYFETRSSIVNGMRINAAKLFLGKRNPSNLWLSLNSEVTKIIIDENSLKAKKVELKIGNTTLQVSAKKDIILSAGTINTPKILKLSGIGPASELKEANIKVLKDLPVGHNLQDHLMFIGLYVKLDRNAVNSTNKEIFIDGIYNYFTEQTGFMGNTSLINLLGFVNVKDDAQYPNIQFHHILFQENDKLQLPWFLKAVGLRKVIRQQFLDANKLNPTLLICPTLLQPASRGYVKLNTSHPLGKPLITSGYFTGENNQDKDNLLKGIRFAQDLLKTEAMKKHKPELIELNLPKCKNYEPDSDDYWRCVMTYLTTTAYNPIGTAKMGPKSDLDAVVDPRLRVKGVKNLRVVDASIMPTSVSANTNAAAMMIGRKGAELIIEEWTAQYYKEV